MHDNFVLYRIIGNDLFPLHAENQSRENLKFVLQNEPELAGCDKRWVVNRIIDKEHERAIIALLEKHGRQFTVIPFVLEDYKRIGLDLDRFLEPGFLSSDKFKSLSPLAKARALAAAYRLKNNYVMNNNGARNVALREGRKHATWVLPWDGNVFVTRLAWEAIRRGIFASPEHRYFIVPMTWIPDNQVLLTERFTPDPIDEPQILFRHDANEEFNEDFPYGRRSKVEFFWRLGVPGDWDRWQDDPWDLERPKRLPDAPTFGVAGWVARMCSGMDAKELDANASFKERASYKGRIRLEAILSTLQFLDGEIAEQACIAAAGRSGAV